MHTPTFQAGKILYFGLQGETGREWFEMVSHASGRTLRAFCEMDDAHLSRDVTLALDSVSHPVDAFVRVMQNGMIKGSTYFRCEPDAVHATGHIAALGKLSQRLPIAAPLRYLGLHPLVCDALIALLRGRDRVGEFVTTHGVTNSLAANGDEGLNAIATAIEVAYLGDETITVRAGTFATQRYALRWHPEWTPAQLWVQGELALFIAMEWQHIGARYELVELRKQR